MVYQVQREIAGKTLTIETGLFANQAHGAVTLRMGDTLVLVTVCTSSPREGINFFPLSVDFEERFSAAGKIPGSFFRREGRPSTEATLAARFTDRPIRPLFPKGFRNEVQVVATVLSADLENPPDILSIIGASAALTISPIPFEGPISGCRIGRVDDQLIVNPTFDQMSQSSIDVVLASSWDGVVMVEAGAKKVSEGLLLDAMREGIAANREIISMIRELAEHVGVPKMEYPPAPEVDPEIEEAVRSLITDRLNSVVFSGKEKGERDNDLSRLSQEVTASLSERFPTAQISLAFQEQVRSEFRDVILSKGIRPDGRGTRDVRPITTAVGILPRTHGSGLFTRGQTQILSTVTLGSLGERQKLDGLSPLASKRYLHHYNFPPYSVGEVRRVGTAGRREIGHGALAERALMPVIPDEDVFPYTIRVVSDALSSNGSTSMGSVCGSTLALMDAGVPITEPVAGIAMGLILGDDGKYVVLTDLQGIEDHEGDMDFKVAGTAEGVTALQMDIKVSGVDFDIMEEALQQAKDARLFILGRMSESIDEIREELSPYAPRMVRMMIPVEKIGVVIGPGGKTIRGMIEEFKVTIDVADDGSVTIGSSHAESAKKVQERISLLTREVVIGDVYTGKVSRITSFGAFVEILPGKDGLVRTPDISDEPVERVEDVVKVGDEISVMVIEIDHMGRVNVSRKAILDGSGVPPARDSSRGSGPPRRFPPGGGRPRDGFGDRFRKR
jgi:polyribonucleotide nucleotidyltransferase